MYVLYIIVDYSFSWFHGLTSFRYLLLCLVVVFDGLNVSVSGCILLDLVSPLVGFGFHINLLVVASYFIDLEMPFACLLTFYMLLNVTYISAGFSVPLG